jgi:hypothetical protein
MGLRIVYKDGEQKACSLTEAQNLVANEGWSWNNSAPKAVKKTAKPKKAKVEVEAVELKPVKGEDLKVIDFGNIDEEK